MKKKEALIHFSGGLDSLLSTMKTIESGYRAVLIHYNNGCMKGLDNIRIGYERLLTKYGSELVRILGYGMIGGYFQALRGEYYQMTIEEMKNVIPHIKPYQINCLTCRAAMYVYSVLVCQKENINTVVDGARKSQRFILEQEIMLEKFREFFQSYNIKLLTPVLNLDDDYEREIAIKLRGFNAKPNESQCYIGCPATRETEDMLAKQNLEAANLWNQKIEPTCRKLVKYSQNIILDYHENPM